MPVTSSDTQVTSQLPAQGRKVNGHRDREVNGRSRRTRGAAAVCATRDDEHAPRRRLKGDHHGLVQVGNDIELDTVCRQFEPYR